MAGISYAKGFLEHWGAIVEEIETCDSEQSDFLASIDAAVLLIEEKTKVDNPDDLAKRRKAFDAGQVYSSSRRLVRDNRLSGVVRKAASQLASSASKPYDFRLVWFTGTGYQAEALSEQFITTLYGTTNIIEMGSSHFRRCYFFRNSDFHRYAGTIDGAIVAHVVGESLSAKLCVNPLSPRASNVRSSAFLRRFGKAVEDPDAREHEGEAFIVTGDLDRKNENALLAELQRKYSTKPLMTFDLGYHSAAVAIRADER
jgi:hypothetical protein